MTPSILTRLEEGGSREIDREIERIHGEHPGFTDEDYDAAERTSDYVIPPYTTSVDAALALAGRVLPGWTTDVHTADASPETYPIRTDIVGYDDGDWEARLSYCHPSIEPREIGDGFSKSLAAALCIAILKAKALQDGRDG